MASSDPYALVKTEVESSLQAALGQLRTYKSAQTSADEREWSKDELKGTLSALESDVQELEESIRVVQQDPTRFNVALSEVGNRKQFIDRVKGEVQRIRQALPASESSRAVSSRTRPDVTSTRPYRDNVDDEEEEEADFPPNYAAQQQQFYMETQDKMLDTIGNTVSTLKAQAGLMGREVLEQVGMLEDLESGVERSQSRLDRASKKMNEFVQKNKNSKSSWTIFLLTIVLSFLLLAIILI